MARYQDKKVVILGGTSGMGLATAKMLLAERRTRSGDRPLASRPGLGEAGAWD